jgi:hypothetical protein
MRILLTCIVLLILVPLAAPAEERTQRLYRWVDAEGIVHFGDTIPAEYMDIERQVVNEHGVTIEILRAKRTEEEIAAEKRRQELAVKAAVQDRQDHVLLSTYLSVDEIEMHRDRRIELFQAQTRVTELYLSNLRRQLETLEREAAKFSPYSADPEAAQVDPELVGDITSTKDTIDRHQANLERFNADAQNVVSRFDGDINRFKQLKGLN